MKKQKQNPSFSESISDVCRMFDEAIKDYQLLIFIGKVMLKPKVRVD